MSDLHQTWYWKKFLIRRLKLTKRLVMTGIAFLLLTVFTSMASATLLKIGTATLNYGFGDVGEFQLLWDEGEDLVWLDYTKSSANWGTVYMWAKNLDQNLTLNLSAVYEMVTPDDAEWRLPYRGDSILTSEMGHMFYTSVGFVRQLNDDDRLIPFTKTTLNSKEFDNLEAGGYWTEGESSSYSDQPQSFNTAYGSISNSSTIGPRYGIAVLDAQVSQVSAVPVPGTIGLLSFGILGLAGIIRRQNS